MSILKTLIASTFTWEALSNLFYHDRWNGNSDFVPQVLVDPVGILPISNISVCTKKKEQQQQKKKKKHKQTKKKKQMIISRSAI